VALDSIVEAGSHSFNQRIIKFIKLVDSIGSCQDFGTQVVDSSALDLQE
jgi:hypothetical protein